MYPQKCKKWMYPFNPFVFKHRYMFGFVKNKIWTLCNTMLYNLSISHSEFWDFGGAY
jgi:hypothetical protein